MSLVGVALAAGAGSRLYPLTRHAPKALCPVGNTALIEHALGRLATVADTCAVNAHHGAVALAAHLDGRVHLSIEEPDALGTAGALGALRPWIDGRPVMVTNADAWLGNDIGDRLRRFVDEWDGERVRLLCVEDVARGDFGNLRYCGVSLMPWEVVRSLSPHPSGLYEKCWREAFASGTLDLVAWPGEFIDCGTVADYLAANLAWSGGSSVIAPGVRIDGEVVRSVVWSGGEVGRGEVLTDAIRGPGWTILSR